MQRPIYSGPRRRIAHRPLVLSIALGFVAWLPVAHAEPVTIQGSTTFYSQILEPNRQLIERRSQQKLEVIPNKTSHGLMALLEGRTRMAMISGPLASEVESMRRKRPDLPFDRLRTSEIGRTRVAVVVHPSNPVRRIELAELAKVLRGELTSWRELGGRDIPIAVVTVKPGGGVPTTIRSAILGGQSFTSPNLIEVEAPRHVVKVTGQLEEALGLTQLGLARQASLPELQLDGRIEQELHVVTLGDPDARAAAVIEALRAVAVDHLH